MSSRVKERGVIEWKKNEMDDLPLLEVVAVSITSALSSA